MNMWYSNMRCLPVNHGVLPVKLRILPDEHSLWLWFQPVYYIHLLLFRVSYTKRNHVQVRMAENMHLDFVYIACFLQQLDVAAWFSDDRPIISRSVGQNGGFCPRPRYDSSGGN